MTARLMKTLRRNAPFAAVLAATLVAYVATAARHVLGHDNGEYVTLAAEGGVAHPPGYPLYVLWLRTWSWLPASSGAHRAALATAVLGVATVIALYAACRRWFSAPWGAAAATAVYATSPRAWLLSTHAENLALHALVAAVTLWLAAPGSRVEPRLRAVLLAVVIGLGLANHHTIVLVLPVALWGLIRAVRASPYRKGTVCLAALGGLFGLSPYAYLVTTARQAGDRWVWGHTGTLDGLIDHVLRSEYGSFALLPQRDAAAVDAVALLGDFAQRVGEDLLWAPALVGVMALGLGASALFQPGRKRLYGPALLALGFVMAGPILASQLGVAPRGIGRYQLARMYLLPELMLTVFIARGLTRFLLPIRHRWRLLAFMPAALTAIGAAWSLPAVREHHRPTVELYLDNTLRSLPEGSIVLAMGDLRLFGFMALQRVEGRRRDVEVVMPTMLFRDWYRQRVERQLGVRLDMVTPHGIDMAALASGLMSSGRALFIMDADQNHMPILDGFPNHPHGTCIRILQPGSAVPPVEELERATRALFEGYRLEHELPADPEGFGAMVYRDYARPWHFLAAEYKEKGDTGRAGEMEKMAEAFTVR